MRELQQKSYFLVSGLELKVVQLLTLEFISTLILERLKVFDLPVWPFELIDDNLVLAELRDLMLHELKKVEKFVVSFDYRLLVNEEMRNDLL